MENSSNQNLDLAKIKEKLGASQGKRYWRTLEELAETPEFMDALHEELPQAARTSEIHVDRRQFLTLGAASLALAGLSGCRYLPQKKLVPYVIQPEIEVVGIPLLYATAVPGIYGYGNGALVLSHEGRPTKVDGNPKHPGSLGALDALSQSTLLSLYDPDRAQVVSQNGDTSTWDEFFGFARPLLAGYRKSGGAELRFLTPSITSPTFIAQMNKVLAQFPAAKWIQYEPVNRDNARQGSTIAFGSRVDSYYDLTNAKRIVSLDADFLLSMPGSVRYAHDFANGRRVRKGTTADNLSRLYVLESAPTITGASADHKIAMRASQIPAAAAALLQALGGTTASTGALEADVQQMVAAIAVDLQANPGASVVIAGEFQPPVVHAIAHAINEMIGAPGKTVHYTQPIEVGTGAQVQDMKQLVTDLNSGSVQMLVIMGGNPAFDAPEDYQFAQALSKVTNRIRLSQYEDETSQLCQWLLPESHYLEAWSDIRSYDGTASVVQPLIEPLYDTRSSHELISGLFDAELTDVPGVASVPEPQDGFHLVRDYWMKNGVPDPSKPFDFDFNKVLFEGFVAGSAPKEITTSVNAQSISSMAVPPPSSASGANIEVILRPDPTMWDGRNANNGWLQELPKQFTKTTWDNVALMSPETAASLQIPINKEGNKTSPLVTISVGGNSIKVPVWTVPGHPDNAVTVFVGYGRTNAGHVGTGTGFNAYPLITSTGGWNVTAQLAYNGDGYDIATTQHHHLMDGRDIVRAGSIQEFLKRPSLAPDEADDQQKAGDYGRNLNQPDEYPAFDWPTKKIIEDGDAAYAYAWGMSIDLSVCIGCNACLVACQSENNIPIVGKNQVMRGRHMNWLRIDTYYESNPGDYTTYFRHPKVYFQPLTCMQCEQAPCEPVCPAAATMHSVEGINQMVYNRCIGTRYCSNNCPYKVRRFNFLNYNNHFSRDRFGRPMTTLEMVYNPEVTVRSRGVMEKCEFCIQRINKARQTAKIENRPIADGEIRTACQQVCPVEAVVFGNINDPNSKVSQLKSQPQDYGLLADLNTRPRLTYLARVTNPNPSLSGGTEQHNG